MKIFLTLVIIIAIILSIEGIIVKFITVSELKQRVTQIVTEIESTKEEMVVTKNGKPVVLMSFITDEAFSLKGKEKGKAGRKKRG